MSQVKKAFSKSTKMSRIPTISPSSPGKGSELSIGRSGTVILPAGSVEEDHVEDQPEPGDQGLVFRTSCLTPRTPPPKSIFKKER